MGRDTTRADRALSRRVIRRGLIKLQGGPARRPARHRSPAPVLEAAWSEAAGPRGTRARGGQVM